MVIPNLTDPVQLVYLLYKGFIHLAAVLAAFFSWKTSQNTAKLQMRVDGLQMGIDEGTKLIKRRR